ncbi:hypothetical protein OIU78_019041 [Salix suchowensis]|nr:hypothetical protein OIU78_019041 [Salix suchowensis]
MQFCKTILSDVSICTSISFFRCTTQVMISCCLLLSAQYFICYFFRHFYSRLACKILLAFTLTYGHSIFSIAAVVGCISVVVVALIRKIKLSVMFWLSLSSFKLF